MNGRLFVLIFRRFSRTNLCSSPYARIVDTPFNVSPKCWKIGLLETLSNLFNSTLDLKYATPITVKIAVIKAPANRNPGVITVIKITIVVTERISPNTAIKTHDVSWSTVSISFENRFIIRPIGVVSKNRILAPVTLARSFSNNTREARRPP